MSSRIAPDDLRRAARTIIALRERDDHVLDLVTSEVHASDRWQQHALACGLVARVALDQIVEDERDDGALALWLHSRVEQTINDADAWWRDADDADDE